MGSGGSNKRKGTVEQYQRIDSYDKHTAELFGCILVKKTTGATVRKYFNCPKCGRTSRFLYVISNKRLVCRECLSANYAIQQMGREELAVERARKIFEKLGVDLSDMCPMDFMQYRSIDKPKDMTAAVYCRLVRELWKQQDIWFDCAMRILK